MPKRDQGEDRTIDVQEVRAMGRKIVILVEDTTIGALEGRTTVILVHRGIQDYVLLGRLTER